VLGHGHGHIEEGASTKNIFFGVLKIVTWIGKKLGHRKAEIMKYEVKASL
jgi:hypothetical protein